MILTRAHPGFSLGVLHQGRRMKCKGIHSLVGNEGHQGVKNYNYFHSSSSLTAKPKRGSIVDTYQTVSVNCSKCRERLFRYKKKNGTKSNLIKCYIERIAEDSCGVIQKQKDSGISQEDYIDWKCPSCQSQFARSATIKGLPALKLVGGKVRMTKK